LTLDSEQLFLEGIGSAGTNTGDVLRVDKEGERGALALGVGRGSCIRCIAMGGEGEENEDMEGVEHIPVER
jgi:hypothetical protein